MPFSVTFIRSFPWRRRKKCSEGWRTSSTRHVFLTGSILWPGHWNAATFFHEETCLIFCLFCSNLMNYSVLWLSSWRVEPRLPWFICSVRVTGSILVERERERGHGVVVHLQMVWRDHRSFCVEKGYLMNETDRALTPDTRVGCSQFLLADGCRRFKTQLWNADIYRLMPQYYYYFIRVFWNR